MKSLVPWMCLLVASATQQAFAENEFYAYRMGNYNKAAEPLISKTGQDPIADYYLGRLFLYGYGNLKNNSVAIRYFTKAAEKGYLPAVQFMAKYALFQQKNPDEATRWFKQAAAAGDVDAQMFMAAAFLYGFGVKPNVDVATKYYIDAAKNGNAIAQYALAENFIDSRHASNGKLGLIWLTKSANKGNLRAVTRLGRLYIDGKLVPKDRDKGLDLLNKAASEQFAPAMIALGDAALAIDAHQEAIQWYNKAMALNDSTAYLHLAHAYLQAKSPIYDANAGFLWTLKAAQNGVTEAKSELATLYQKGIGVAVNPDLAKQWADSVKQDNKNSAMAQAALWLSNNTTNKLEQTVYQIKGIFSPWQNAAVLRDNTYNQAPQIETLNRHDLFKPQFGLIQPNDVPINHYYDALISKNAEFQGNQWTYPSYPLNKQIAALERMNSLVMAKVNKPAPDVDANYYDYDDYASGTLIDEWIPGWQQQANYKAVFTQLYSRALLGDAQSQFEIGQMFQYGLGVEQNDASAIIFYQNAAEQQHLGAEYNLGILYLHHPQSEEDYQTALNWLTDSAFKGNRKSQYALARILTIGKSGEDGKVYIQPNPEQAQSMLYLAAANHYGPAEFELAENLARTFDNGLSVEVKKQKLALIRSLYQGAAGNGVMQALVPLAFYNAMDQDPTRQAEAFIVADQQAQAGDDHAALLLGMLYDRGIGVGTDAAKALYWYQHAGENPVSQFILGTYTAEGRGVTADKEQGLALLNQSLAARFSYANFNVSVLKKEAGGDFLPDLIAAYTEGNSHAGIVLADYYLSQANDVNKMNEAIKIYVGLAEKGDQYAQLKLAYMLENGLGTATDALAAQRWYTASAEQGNALAQFLLGQFYQVGVVDAPDYQQAKYWYQKAAPQLSQASVALGFIDETVDDNYADALKAYESAATRGDEVGMNNLGLMYLYGKGVAVDYSKAKALFTQAADKGDAAAMNQLGGIYFNGLGQTRDVQQGMVWFQKAAALGNSSALYELGLLTETGVETKMDATEAVKYYQKAADQDNERAMLALARIYHFGLGVPKDLKVSAKYYEKLAARQNAYAQYQLGTYYLEGIAGERAPDKGKQLLKQASDNGSVEAQKALQKLDEQLKAQVSMIKSVIVSEAKVMFTQANDLMDRLV